MMNVPGGGAPLPVAGAHHTMPHASGAYMPPVATPPHAMPPSPSASSGGGRLLAGLLLGQGAFVLAFFMLSIVAVWIRAERGEGSSGGSMRPSSAPASEPVEAPAPAAWVAIVVIPRKDLKTGALRPRPAFDANPPEWIPEGTEVDVLSCDTVAPKWCQVRTKGWAPRTGWMHSTILRRK